MPRRGGAGTVPSHSLGGEGGTNITRGNPEGGEAAPAAMDLAPSKEGAEEGAHLRGRAAAPYKAHDGRRDIP